MMNSELKNKTALVCGSTRGIGKATAIALAQLGANVILVARNEQSLKEVQSLLPVAGGQKHSFLIADFDQPQMVEQAVRQFIEKNGPINILVNYTGGPPSGPILEAKTTAFET